MFFFQFGLFKECSGILKGDTTFIINIFFSFKEDDLSNEKGEK
jgi:hypothetical protein